MIKKKKVVVTKEKKTYLKGFLKGKYRGENNEKFDEYSRLKVFNIDIYEGELHDFILIEERDYDQIKSTPLIHSALFQKIVCTPLKNKTPFEAFKLRLEQPKLDQINVFDVQKNDSETFGSIHCLVYACLIERYTEEEWIEYEVPDKEKRKKPRRKVWKAKHTKTYKRSKKNDWDGVPLGCLNLLKWFVFALMGMLLLIIVVQTKSVVILIGLGVLLVRYLIQKYEKSRTVSKKISYSLGHIISYLTLILYCAIIGIGLAMIIKHLFTKDNGNNFPKAEDSTEETTRIYYDSLAQDTLVVHHRIWSDYTSHTYEKDIVVKMSNYRKSAIDRTQMKYNGKPDKYWNGVYSQFAQSNEPYLDSIYSTLDSIKLQGNLSEIQFAESIVTMIQDIPYVLILSGECDPKLYDDKFIKEYLNACNNTCCLGKIGFGVQTPIEFMTNLKGDCDTRTVLAFTLLSHYNYPVAILNSNEYSHSILGLGLPYNGTYKAKNGIKYYLWETTAYGWRAGQISPENANMNYWHIVLKNKVL